MATSRLSLTPCCPMYSARTRGRSDNSNVASSSIIEPAITRLDICFSRAPRLTLCQNLERALEQHIECRIGIAIPGPAHCGFGVSAQIPEILQRRQNVTLYGRFDRALGEVLQP